MKRKSKFLVIAIALIILGAMLSNAIDTSFGAVKTERLYLIDDDGYTVTANIFIPKAASAENPAPAMIITPGGDCPSDIGMPWATEIARRGYVVALMDYTGCGDTEVNPNAQYWTANGAMELDTVYDYLASRPFVDAGQIGCGGHSMGSLYSYRLSTKRTVSMVISDVLFADALPEYDFNFVQISGTHDEGLLARLGNGNFDAMFSDEFLCSVFGVDRIQPNTLYGSFEDRTARVFYTLNQTHQDDMISGPFIQLLVSSVMAAMPAPNPIDATNLIYGWKICGLGAALVGLVMFLFSMAGILVDSSLFCDLKLSAPAKPAGFEFKSGKWWAAAAIYTLIPVAFFFWGTGVGNKMASNSLFQLGTTPNGYLVWTLFSAVGMLVFFLAYHFVYGKKAGLNASSYGFASSDDGSFKGRYILKSALLALVLFLLAYYVVLLLYRYANTDLHIWTSSIRPIRGARCETLPWYCLALLPYFTLLLLAGNAVPFGSVSEDGKGMAKSVIGGAVVGLVGMLALLLVYEVLLRLNGPFTTKNFAHFYLDLLTNTLPTFGVASALAIYLRKKTNSYFAGILTGVSIVAFCMVSTNCVAMIIS